jgi:dolichyl-diphosphooligosaccharide--protein glycosyltransferase
MSDGSRVEEVIADRPDLESALADILPVDEETQTWTFDDVPVDSGTFGQLVSEGIVEKNDGEYRLADRTQVRAALGDGDATPAEDTGTSVDVSLPSVDASLVSVDARAVGLVAATLALVVVARSFVAGSVFRGEDVVLSANDPYFYRYWVEQTLATGDSLSQLPGGIEHGEPMLVATLAWISGLVGGVDAAGVVLAIYPVASAVLVSAMLYLLSVWLTDDRRIGLAAVVMLAFTPGQALRTALGFADHHAFDYIWLSVTVLGLVVLATVEDQDQYTDTSTILATLAIGIGVGAQPLAWDNGPLLLVPIAIVVATRVLLDLRAGRSSLVAGTPLLAGLTLASVISVLGHVTLDWHTLTVVATPPLLLGGSVAVFAAGDVARRFGRSVAELAVLEAIAALVGLLGAWLLVPDLIDKLISGLGLIGRTDDIAEVQPLFSGDTFGFLLLFGFVLFLAIPVLAWTTRWAVDGDTRWLVVCTYGWYFFVLSLFQVRFIGQLSFFTALFAGMAFVWLAAKVDLTRPPVPFDSGPSDESDWLPGRPDASTVAAVFVLFLLVGGIGVMQTAIKVEQVTIDDSSYETAAYLADYADERQWEGRGESYVFSNWGRTRMFNYFVNGNSRSYGYAQSNYADFIAEGNPEFAAEMIASRARFAVTEQRDAKPRTMQARLHDNLGSRAGEVAGVGQFRAIYATADGQRRAFLVVPGATVRGNASANATVDVSTSSPIDISGTSFTYERRTAANATGVYEITVAHPGTYEITTGGDTVEVTVPESAVMNGTTVDVGA